MIVFFTISFLQTASIILQTKYFALLVTLAVSNIDHSSWVNLCTDSFLRPRLWQSWPWSMTIVTMTTTWESIAFGKNKAFLKFYYVFSNFKNYFASYMFILIFHRSCIQPNRSESLLIFVIKNVAIFCTASTKPAREVPSISIIFAFLSYETSNLHQILNSNVIFISMAVSSYILKKWFLNLDLSRGVYQNFRSMFIQISWLVQQLGDDARRQRSRI